VQTAFLFINTKLDPDDNTTRDLKNMKGVEEVHRLYGVYDMSVKIKADNLDRIKDIVQNIRNLKVGSILTLLTSEKESAHAF